MKKSQTQFILAYRDYSDFLFRYTLSKLNNRESAKDLIQETFFRVWRYLSEGHEIISIKAFLFKTANNLITDSYRKKAYTVSLDYLEEEGFDPSSDDTDRWTESMDRKQVLTLIQEIHQPYRDMLFMRYVKGLSIGEIVKMNRGVSEDTVSVRIHRGIGMLRELLTDKTKNILSARLESNQRPSP